MSVNRKVTVPWVGRSSALRPPFATDTIKHWGYERQHFAPPFVLGGSPVSRAPRHRGVYGTHLEGCVPTTACRSCGSEVESVEVPCYLDLVTEAEAASLTSAPGSAKRLARRWVSTRRFVPAVRAALPASAAVEWLKAWACLASCSGP